MKHDMGDWKPAVDKLIGRLEGGSWRHGLKTDDAVREVARYGGFPADVNTMWPVKWRKKNGDLLKFSLYYYVQAHLKNRRRPVLGKSGTAYRVRSAYNVKHGVSEGECDDNGDPVAPEKKGLWLRREDLNKVDVGQARAGYTNREGDSTGDKRWLDAAAVALEARSNDTVCDDVAAEIEAAL